MQVLEIKNNLVKIAYDVKDNLALSSFVIIEDTNTPYVAQVVNIKADKLTNFAIVKLLFTFNEEGILKNYNGTIPSLKSTVSILPSNELLDIIPVETPLLLGHIAQQDVTLNVDKTILDNNLLVCSDNVENTNTLIKNITKQIDEKIVIFDTDGLYDAENKIVFGQDFKLPLNYNTINFIYENDLEDVDATSKAVIQDIFMEVQKYTQTLPEGYLPFDTFVNVVDQQYKESQIPQLVLLKNKLLKYQEINAFAETLKDVLSLSIAIDKSHITVIDISDMTPTMQKEIIAYAYRVMNNIDENIYSFIKIDNTNSSKKLLKTFLQRSNIFTTVICKHEYKYLPELKSAAQNLILFMPQTLQHDFAGYNTFLNKLNSDEFIVYGAHTQNIPLIVELEELEPEKDETEDLINNPEQNTQNPEIVPMPELPKQDSNENLADNSTEIVEDEATSPEEHNIDTPNIEYPDFNFDGDSSEQTIEISDEPNFEEQQNIQIVESSTNSDFQEIEEEPEFIENLQENEISDLGEDANAEQLNIQDNEPFIEDVVQPDNQVIEEEIIPEAEDNLPLDETFTNSEMTEPVYNILEDSEPVEAPEVVPLEPEIDYSVEEMDIEENFQEPQLEYDDNEAMIEQAAKDVDKFIYEKLPDEDVSLNELSDLQSDELTEDDLNLIGDLATDNNIEPESLEYSEETPPVVPIYNADDIEPTEPQTFEPGDRVTTPGLGEGVVERMIKYGNKVLCSIEFPNIGRRLLDPAMREIKKI